jgi:hypothetical protein
MKKFLIIPIAALLLSSCGKYQMNTLSSLNTKQNTTTGVFELENDSVKILYSFAGHNIPIEINIYNKLNEPVFVDWERSALIMGDKSVTYADETIQINGVVSSTSTGRYFRVSDAYVSGQITLPKNVAFVPPHTQINKTLSKISEHVISPINDSLFTKIKLASFYDPRGIKAKLAKFNSDNSPLRFKSYLTLYTLNGNTPKFMVYQNDFYISQVIRTASGADGFDSQSGRGDSFDTWVSN